MEMTTSAAATPKASASASLSQPLTKSERTPSIR